MSHRVVLVLGAQGRLGAAAVAAFAASGWRVLAQARRAQAAWPAGVVPMCKALAEMRYLWFRPHALSGARLLACVGELPQTPARQAMRQALVDLGFA